MVLLNVANSACRYLLSVVLIGADELLVFAIIWMVTIGMILVTIDRRHIALDLDRTDQRAGAVKRINLPTGVRIESAPTMAALQLVVSTCRLVVKPSVRARH